MERCLKEWHELLKTTGGDLSQHKCKISILQWKPKGNYGLLIQTTINDNNQSIILHLEIQTKEKMERLETDMEERILEVRLPITGEMQQEFKHRKQQIQSMAKKIKNAPFKLYNTHIIYQCRYKAMIQYPLPITTFNSG